MGKFRLPRGNTNIPDTPAGGGGTGTRTRDPGRQYDRFWLKKGEKRTVTFLNDVHEIVGPVLELAVIPNMDFRETRHFVSGKNFGRDCPLTELANTDEQVQAYNVWYYSILDHTPYTRKGENGEPVEVEYSRKLIPFKRESAREFVEQCEDQLGVDLSEGFEDGTAPDEPILRGSQWTVKRSSGNTSPRTGSNWIKCGQLSEEELAEYEPNVPFDYEDRLQLHEEEMAEWASRIKASPRPKSTDRNSTPFGS